MTDRIVDLTAGITMVVSDLHGDKDAFSRYMGRYLQLRNRGKADRLLLLGDLIHSEGPEHQDESLSMILDVMTLQRSLAPGDVIMLLGNHEMPHLYGITLAKGKTEFTPRFEKAMTRSGQRDEVIAFLNSLPFFVRTAAGVMFTHAGPDSNAMANVAVLRQFDHQAILGEYDHALALNPQPEQLRTLYGQTMGMPYEMLARYYLAVSGPSDPRYDDLVRSFMISQQSREFELLWDTLFTQCEQETRSGLYERQVASFLEQFSEGAPAPQRFLVTGHMSVKGGHQVVTSQHLRVASATHARPREAGQYLLLDFGHPIHSIEELVVSLGSVF